MPPAQTSYSYDMPVGVAGMVADSSHAKDIDSKVNPVVAIPFGVAVCRGVDPDRDVKLPTTLAEASACVGVAVRDGSIESSASGVPQYPIGSAVAVLDQGRIWVTVEAAVTPTDPVYVRYGTGVADNTKVQKGAFGKSGDGTAQVTTLTPTAANDTNYWVEIDGKNYGVLSDGSATATKIVTAFKALINADTATSGVTATGTATLILTGTANQAFTVRADARMAAVATTPFAGSAGLLAGARYMTSALAGGLAILELNQP